MLHLAQSPTDPAFVQDPYPFYERARAAGGDLIFWSDYDMVCAVSHAAVTALLRDRRLGREAVPGFFPAPPPELAPFYAVEAHSMLELNPPRHTRLRALVMRAFTSRRIADLAPGIASLCDSLIDDFPADPFDLIAAYATPVPVVTICRLLGVPEEDSETLLTWSNAMVGMYQARRTPQMAQAAADAAAAFTSYMHDYVAERRQRPGNDLMTELIAAQEAQDKLSTDELITTCILLLNAGHEATVHSIGNGAAAMMREGLTLADANVVEEVLRHDPPLHLFTRWVNEDVTLFGHDFRRGDQVACILAAANRDPDVWERADVFDPTRYAAPRPPVHAAFGGGLHFCVGAPLARMEIEIALARLFARCPDLRPAEAPRYADLYHFHGFGRLSVCL